MAGRLADVVPAARDGNSRITEGERLAAEAAVARLKAAEPVSAPKPPPALDVLTDRLASLRIQCERSADRVRSCCREGCVAVVNLDEPPTYWLRCDKCHQHMGYLPHRASAELRRLDAQTGAVVGG